MSFSYSKSCCSSLWCLVSQKKSNFLAAFDVDLKEEKEVSLLMLFCFSFLTLACFHQSVIGRRLASPFIAKSWTAYSLKECEQFCVSEKGFTCRGFAYREIQQDEQKVQNCDLSQKNTSDLDPYNEQHFLQHPVTDFYEIKVKDNCFDIAGQDKIDINDVEILSSSSHPDYSDNWPQATFLQPQSGEDAVVIIQKTSSGLTCTFKRLSFLWLHFAFLYSRLPLLLGSSLLCL